MRLNKDYNYFLHEIKNASGSQEIAEKIMREGLEIKSGHKTVLSTAVSIGDMENDVESLLYAYRYRFTPDSEQYKMVIKTPTIIKNSKGEALYLGNPGINTLQSMQEYDQQCMLDIVCCNLKMIPREFVKGYLTPDNEAVSNPNHYDNLSPEQMDALFKKIEAAFKDPSILKVSEQMAKKDFAGLKKYLHLYKQYELHELVEMIYNFLKENDPDFMEI